MSVCVCVCGAQEKKKKRKVKLADWRSQQRERKVGFDWRFGIRGTVLIGPWECYVTVKWGGDFDDFFKVFWVNLKLPERQCGKFEMTFVSWNRWLETFLVFFLASTLDSLAEAWLALLVSCLQNPFLFICTWNCLSYFSLTFAIIIGINCNFCPLNMGFICQAPFIASLISFSIFN